MCLLLLETLYLSTWVSHSATEPIAPSHPGGRRPLAAEQHTLHCTALDTVVVTIMVTCKKHSKIQLQLHRHNQCQKTFETDRAVDVMDFHDEILLLGILRRNTSFVKYGDLKNDR